MTRWLFVAMAALVAGACANVQRTPPPEAVAALAPTGKLRVGLYSNNPLQVVRDPVTQEMKGVGFELGKELARRLGVPFEPVVYPSIGALLAGTTSGQWDVAFYQVNPARLKDVDFTSALVEVELGYLVPKGSSISISADVDRPTTRIAVQEKGQADVILTRALRQAAVVRAPGLTAALDMVKSGQAEAVATIKPSLFELLRDLPGWRVLDGRFATESVAMAVPKGRGAGSAYAGRFIADVKAEGLAKAAIERASIRGAAVAPQQ